MCARAPSKFEGASVELPEKAKGAFATPPVRNTASGPRKRGRRSPKLRSPLASGKSRTVPEVSASCRGLSVRGLLPGKRGGLRGLLFALSSMMPMLPALRGASRHQLHGARSSWLGSRTRVSELSLLRYQYQEEWRIDRLYIYNGIIV